MRKRSRSTKDKIDDCLDMCIQNLTTEKRAEMFDLLMSDPKLNENVIRCRKFVVKTLNLPVNGKNTYKYWIGRGWSESAAKYKCESFNQELRKKKPRFSPFSKEFWMTKINPQTNANYTEDEATFEQNSRRPIRKEYWMKKGYSIEDSVLKASETKDENNKRGTKTSMSRLKEQHRSSSHRCIEYWILRGLTIEEATEKVAKEQSTFSLEKCIDKHGEIKGTKKWADRQEKWLKNYKKTNFSKVSQLLFWEVYEQLTDKSNIHFASLLDGRKDVSGKNNEYVLKTNEMSMKPDFIHFSSKSIIEFDGDYWHGEKRGNQERDAERDAVLLKEGFRVLHIKERDYKQDPTKVIDECLIFLTQ